MKKISIVLCTLFFILFVGNAFGQEKYKQDFNNLATIEFPEKPVMNDMPNNLGQIYKVTGKPNYYFMLLFNFKGDNDAGITDLAKLTDFHEGIVAGAADPEYKKSLIYKKNITIAGYNGIEFEYKDEAQPENVRFIFQRVVYINKYAFMYSFSTPDDSNATNKTERDNFFNSFNILDKSVKQY